MISIIITTNKEPKSLPQAIQSFLDSNLLKADDEILIVGPDEESEKIAKEFQIRFPVIKYLKDKGKGKPAALNLVFQQARGEILILSDGDVKIKKEDLEYLITPFENNKVGAVSGQPISTSSRNNLFGYWSHFLTFAAHQMRLKNRNFPCSGYLFAILKKIIDQIPENMLAEDAVMTQMARNQGYQVVYAPQAKVYIKYPDNFKDWLKQKVRSTGGYVQEFGIWNLESRIKKMRNFWQEVQSGIKLFFIFPKTIKEFFWTILLYLARIYLWLAIFWQIKIRKKTFAHIWQRIESTK
ncbi:MAG: glycosyltransferase family 2 protein [Patescibacteria group bacterium]|nr:glycosyltransferase family 2 protein [Patescibacteria group bacterium]MDD5164841.1 glycosyltransferase family 2 protein [Patescibacteria group bacterium]MDD5534673.1 glycosyltransferase family 2 protein [Patescibacteria group bacterium]